MSNTAIHINQLTKEYSIGTHQSASLRETLVDLTRRQKADKTFFKALDNVTFDIKQGEAFAIVGKNGAGKSTLLKVLSRITHPTKGRIEIKGRVSSLLEVGTGFHPELTGRENIFLNGTILGMRRREVRDKFDEIVAFSGVEKFIDTQVERYSSGVYVRLAFAVAAHLEPEILIIDEVLAVGDAEFQKKCMGKMSQVAKGGRTVVFVSHNMSAVESLCQRGVLLEKGQLTFSGTAAETIQRYLYSSSVEADAVWANSSPEAQGPVVLHRAALVDEAGQYRSTYANTDTITVSMQVELCEAIDNLKVGLELMADLGKPLITSFHNDRIDVAPIALQPGMNHLQVQLPAALLNKGVYTVNLSAGIHKVKMVMRHDGILKFEINFKVLNTAMPVSQRPSVIAPLLHWTTKNN